MNQYEVKSLVSRLGTIDRDVLKSKIREQRLLAEFMGKRFNQQLCDTTIRILEGEKVVSHRERKNGRCKIVSQSTR